MTVRLIETPAGDALPEIPGRGAVPALTSYEHRRHRPDLHLTLADDVVRARVSCWWTATPVLANQRLGVIGHYAADGPTSAAHILTAALSQLKAAGCTAVVGPMDGNTWRRYRFVVERGTEPPFFLEPDNPDEFVGHFTSCGFAPLANYTSALADDLSSDATDLSAPERRLKDGGIAVSHLDMARADETLKRIFHLSLDSFRGNFLYTPLEEDEFLEQNRRVLPAVVPELVLLAERDGELVGFLFGVPDVLQQQRGVRLDTLIVKTVAVAPSAANAGIGGALVALVHARARALGFTRAIHALMHEQNTSQRISRHYARTIRRYTLYWRELTDVAGAAR